MTRIATFVSLLLISGAPWSAFLPAASPEAAMIVDAMPEPAAADDPASDAADERPDPIAHPQAKDGATEDDTEDDRVAAAMPKIERIVKRLMKASAAPGISIAIAADNRLRFAQGYGSADLEHDVPVTTETRFRTASIANR